MPKKLSRYHDRLLEDLRDPQEAAEYVNAAIEEGSQEMLLLALRDVAEAHSMAAVAKGAGVSRESIYRILFRKGNPRLKSFLGLFESLGLDYFVRPKVSRGKRKSLRNSKAKSKLMTSTNNERQMEFKWEDSTRSTIGVHERIEVGQGHTATFSRSTLDDIPEMPAFMIPSTYSNEVSYV